jgi:hypothetical protein
MMESREQVVWMQRALDVMMAYIAEPDSMDFPIFVASRFPTEPDGVSKIFYGLLGVAVMILQIFENATGSPRSAILQEVSRLIEAMGNE